MSGVARLVSTAGAMAWAVSAVERYGKRLASVASAIPRSNKDVAQFAFNHEAGKRVERAEGGGDSGCRLCGRGERGDSPSLGFLGDCPAVRRIDDAIADVVRRHHQTDALRGEKDKSGSRRKRNRDREEGLRAGGEKRTDRRAETGELLRPTEEGRRQTTAR